MGTAFRCRQTVHCRARVTATIISAALLICCGAADLRGQDSPDNHNVALVTQADGTSVDEIVNLTNCTDATITLTAKLDNMESSPPLPLTVDTAGRTHFVLARFTVKLGAATWKYSVHFDSQSGGRLSKPPVPYVYALPFKGAAKVAQGAGGSFSHFKGSPDEQAIDFSLPVGTTVYAARAGVVTGFRADCSLGGPDKSLIGSGNYVMIRQEDGTYAQYLHLSQNGVLVKLGQRVTAGGPLALSGNTGYTSGPHLHFEVFYNIDGTSRKSLPLQFRGSDGRPFTAVEGRSYSNPSA